MSGCVSYDVERLSLKPIRPQGTVRLDRHECAARLVWDHLIACGVNVGRLAELVRTVHDGDSSRLWGGSLTYRQSKTNGVHACFKRLKATAVNAHDLYRGVRGWLDKNWFPNTRAA